MAHRHQWTAVRTERPPWYPKYPKNLTTYWACPCGEFKKTTFHEERVA